MGNSPTNATDPTGLERDQPWTPQTVCGLLRIVDPTAHDFLFGGRRPVSWSYGNPGIEFDFYDAPKTITRNRHVDRVYLRLNRDWTTTEAVARIRSWLVEGGSQAWIAYSDHLQTAPGRGHLSTEAIRKWIKTRNDHFRVFAAEAAAIAEAYYGALASGTLGGTIVVTVHDLSKGEGLDVILQLTSAYHAARAVKMSRAGSTPFTVPGKTLSAYYKADADGKAVIAAQLKARLGASDAIAHLRHAKNFKPGVTQKSIDTCGLHCVGHVFDDVLPPNRAVNTTVWQHNRTTATQLIHSRRGTSEMGLSTAELVKVVNNNKGVSGLLDRQVSAEKLATMINKGPVICHVDTNHFVRPLVLHQLDVEL